MKIIRYNRYSIFACFMVVFFTTLNTFGQCNPNLVPNPKFELGNCSIPSGTGLLNVYTIHNISQTPTTIANWYNPINTSPDWYPGCATNATLRPPRTVYADANNYQEPLAGSTSYVGFYSYGDNNLLNNIDSNYAEYVQVRLTSPLVAGRTYNVSFYVNLAGFEPYEVIYSGNTAYWNYEKRIYGTDKIGAHFSNTPETNYGTLTETTAYLDLEPQIEYVGAPIVDTENWTLISGSFVAVGGEEYMTIGNFRTKAETNLQLVREQSTDFTKYPDPDADSLRQIQDYGYYLLSDVSVIEEPTINTVTASPDVTINEGDSTPLSVTTTGLPAVSYQWTPAIGLSDATVQNPIASPTVTTIYTVAVDFGDGCLVTDQVQVTVNPCSLNIDMSGASSGFIDCNLAATDITGISVTGASASATYQWKDIYGNILPDNDAVLNNVGIGVYYLTVNDGANCIENAQWSVDGDPGITLFSIGNITCPLSGNNGAVSGAQFFPVGGTYEWVNNANPSTVLGNNGSIGGLAPGVYTLTYTFGACTLSQEYDLTPTGPICADNCPGAIDINPYVLRLNGTTIPVTDRTNPYYINLGENVSLFPGITGSSPNSISWSAPGNPDFASFSSPTVTPTVTTTYTLEADFGNGCIRSGSITINVFDPSCPLEITDGFAFDASCGASNGRVENITIINGVAGETYTWTNSGGTVVGNTLALSNVPQGAYTLTVDQGGGCQRSRTWTVGNTSGFSIDAGTDITINSGDSTPLTATPTGSTPVSYNWSPATGLDDATIANPTASPTVTTTYTVTADFSGGCTDTDMVTVTVNTPGCTATIDTGADVTINTGDSTPLAAAPTGGTPVSYSWSPATGLDDAALANPTASPTVTTTYTVTADFGGGCTDTDMVTVTVLDAPSSCGSPNLVPNPSFEEYVTCPTKAINTYSSNEDIQDFLLDWEMPTNGSSDYYHRCGTGGQINIPTNTSGTQEPPSPDQDAYVGFFALDLAHPDNIEYREYLQARLDQPMVAGTSYTVSIKLNLADYSKYSIDEMGVYFGQNRISMPSYNGPLNVTPQLTTPASNMLDDKDNWMIFNWEYMATGGEQFIVIGNFKDDANTDIKDENPVLFPNLRRSVYLLDDVSVTETLGTVTLDAGPDVTIDAGEGTQLGALPTGGTPVSYSWTPATGLDDATIADPTASPAMTTTYTVTADFGGGCTATDQVTVTVVDPACPLMLSGGNVTEATCGLNDGSITGILVNGATGTEDYRWTDTNGTVVGTLLDLANVGLGSYTLTVTESAGCERTLTFAVNESGPPDLDDAALGLADTTCGGTTGSITGITYIGEEVGAVFRWSDSDGTTVGNALDLEGVAAGTYTLQVTDALGCRAIAGPYTIGEPADCEEELPEQGPVRIANTMTPNGDGSNDMFHIQGIEAYPNSVLQVYNRWGNKVFEQRGYRNDWYGTYQGTDLPVATYYYVLSLGDEAQTLRKGYITILR